MKFGLKWVHMARYELILRLDGALWLTIIFKPLLTPQRAFTIQFESYVWMFVTENVSMIRNVRLWVNQITLLNDKNVILKLLDLGHRTSNRWENNFGWPMPQNTERQN